MGNRKSSKLKNATSPFKDAHLRVANFGASLIESFLVNDLIQENSRTSSKVESSLLRVSELANVDLTWKRISELAVISC